MDIDLGLNTGATSTNSHNSYNSYNSNKLDRVSQMANVQKEGLELFKKKNADYGDAFASYGTIGVLVRMGDKISRLQSITNKQISLISTESIRDTLIDLHNYSAMAIMLLDEQDQYGNQNQKKRHASPVTSCVQQNQ